MNDVFNDLWKDFSTKERIPKERTKAFNPAEELWGKVIVVVVMFFLVLWRFTR